jgi:hypothetical protein
MRWSEEELQRLELGVVGAFARGCHNAGIAQVCLLSAARRTARSRFRYARVMGMQEDSVRNFGFARRAIFRPGIIVGNAHTPAWVGWLGSLVPASFGNRRRDSFAQSSGGCSCPRKCGNDQGQVFLPIAVNYFSSFFVSEHSRSRAVGMCENA